MESIWPGPQSAVRQQRAWPIADKRKQIMASRISPPSENDRSRSSTEEIPTNVRAPPCIVLLELIHQLLPQVGVKCNERQRLGEVWPALYATGYSVGIPSRTCPNANLVRQEATGHVNEVRQEAIDHVEREAELPRAQAQAEVLRLEREAVSETILDKAQSSG